MDRYKNIILITSSFPYGRAIANLLRYFTYCLTEGGHKVEVFLPTGAYYGNKLDQSADRAGQIKGIKYRRLGFIFHPKNYIGKIIDNMLGLVLPFLFLLKKKYKRIDTVIVCDGFMIQTIFNLLIKIILKKKLIIILLEYYEKPSKSGFSFAALKWYNFYFGMKYFVKYADKFIVLSEFLKNYVESRLDKSKKILLMPNLIDPSCFSNPTINQFKDNYTTIGYVGTPTHKDGVLDLIKSFSIINSNYPNTHLLIIGDLTNGKSILPELKKYAITQGLNEQVVTFTGLISNKQVPNLLLSCQILALTRPSGVFAEAGFPTKLGEYFSCKKPVVLTKVGDMVKYFIDKKQVVFADPGDINSIVSAFEYLITAKDKALEIGINGYKWMNDFLNYKHQIKKISTFISN